MLPLQESTTRHKFVWFASVSLDTRRPVRKTPQIERRIPTKSPNTLGIEFDAFDNACLNISFFDLSDAN